MSFVCTSCGTENEEGRKFCRECGTALARVCANCGTPNPPMDKFCGECGTALTETASAPSATDAAGAGGVTERRLVSVLFLDLVSFTTLSEQRDAEDMRTLLDRYFETARSVIERHGGVVEKFIGDAVMAVWGAPITHEDDAERAVRAALELVDAVAALGAATATPLQARAGVLTGEAATTAGAADQGMVTGDMVNTASRLQSAAAPGEVFVGEATFRAASRAVAFDEVGELELKGKVQPVRAWRARRVIAGRQGANRLAIEPPFVGRHEQLRLLKDLLHATGREERARVVSVSGIGGIGKSRLAWELEKYVEGLTETFWWHHGRCPAYGEGVTFWALGEMVRMRAGIAETDPASTSRTKLGDAVAEYVDDEEERRWIEPRLAFLLGLAEAPGGGREELFAAWRALFERIAARGTVAMVFEDVQWADAGLLDFIESLLEWSRNLPIFVVTLARPELVDRRPTWGAGQRNFVAIHLEPIADDAMAELVGGMIPGADPAAIAKIVARAEGTPLYAVEMIRMLADRGVLRAGDHAYELVGDLGDVQVPETLQALVASRLDALGPEDRALLQDAAVLGKTFTADALAAISGERPEALEPRLRELLRKEVLVLDVDPRSPERGQYGFVQAILREVAYGMLSKADRRARHLAVAHHYEGLDDDELAGVVAAHYVEALRASPEGPDADALAARARDWLGQAGDRATSLGSPVQALSFAEQALAITPAGAERAALLDSAARAAFDALKEEEAIAYRRERVDVLTAAGDVNGEVTALGELGRALYFGGNAEEYPAIMARMRERLGDGGDDRAKGELAFTASMIAFDAGDLTTSLAEMETALGHLERTEARDVFLDALGGRIYLLGNLGRHQEARMLMLGQLAVAKEENDLRAVAGALQSLAVRSGESIEGLRLHLESAEVARRGGYGGMETSALANAIEAAVEAGEWELADQLIAQIGTRPEIPEDIRDTVELSVALLAAYRGDTAAAEAAIGRLGPSVTGSILSTMRAWHRRVLSVVHAMAGAIEEGYADGMAALQEEPEGMNSPWALWVAGRAALWLRDAAKARAALDLAGVIQGRWTSPTRSAIEAGVAALEGHPAQAASAYADVLSKLLADGDPFTHAFTVVDAVAVLPVDLLPEGAFETARAYLEGLGAKPGLERLAAAEPRVTAET